MNTNITSSELSSCEHGKPCKSYASCKPCEPSTSCKPCEPSTPCKPCEFCTPCCPCCPPGPKPEPEPENPCVICPDPQKEYAYYFQSGRLYNGALFGGIRFEQPPVQTEGIDYDTGIVTIFKPGTYLFTYIVNFPQEAIVNTNLVLEIDNEPVPGTTLVISKTGTAAAYTATAQAIVRTTGITRYRLTSSASINIMTPASNTVASLTIIEL